jgi:hypothetical protein
VSAGGRHGECKVNGGGVVLEEEEGVGGELSSGAETDRRGRARRG